MKKKFLSLLFLFLIAVSPLLAQEQPEKITDMEAYVSRLIKLNSTGENNSWQILDALSAQMNEGSPVFKTLLKEAGKGNDTAKYLVGKFYINKGKNEEAIKMLGKVSSDRYRNARFLLATALMNKAKRMSQEVYYLGASEILNGLKNVKVESLANTESIDFLLKACEKGTAERRIFTQTEIDK